MSAGESMGGIEPAAIVGLALAALAAVPAVRARATASLTWLPWVAVAFVLAAAAWRASLWLQLPFSDNPSASNLPFAVSRIAFEGEPEARHPRLPLWILRGALALRPDACDGLCQAAWARLPGVAAYLVTAAGTAVLTARLVSPWLAPVAALLFVTIPGPLELSLQPSSHAMFHAAAMGTALTFAHALRPDASLGARAAPAWWSFLAAQLSLFGLLVVGAHALALLTGGRIGRARLRGGTGVVLAMAAFPRLALLGGAVGLVGKGSFKPASSSGRSSLFEELGREFFGTFELWPWGAAAAALALLGAWRLAAGAWQCPTRRFAILLAALSAAAMIAALVGPRIEGRVFLHLAPWLAVGMAAGSTALRGLPLAAALLLASNLAERAESRLHQGARRGWSYHDLAPTLALTDRPRFIVTSGNGIEFILRHAMCPDPLDPRDVADWPVRRGPASEWPPPCAARPLHLLSPWQYPGLFFGTSDLPPPRPPYWVVGDEPPPPEDVLGVDLSACELLLQFDRVGLRLCRAPEEGVPPRGTGVPYRPDHRPNGLPGLPPVGRGADPALLEAAREQGGAPERAP